MQLKLALMKTPVLSFTNYSKPFLLEMYTSKDGLDAVLLQKGTDGKYHPIAYRSKALTKSERNYHSSKLEFLALKWAIIEHFKEYLQYAAEPFLIRTDKNPLMYMMTTPNLDATGHQWVGALTNYNFNIEYLKGCDNSAADVLSKMTECLEDDDVKCLLDSITIRAANQADLHNPLMQQADIEHNICVNAVRLTNNGPKGEINVVAWAQAQCKDPELEIAIR